MTRPTPAPQLQPGHMIEPGQLHGNLHVIEEVESRRIQGSRAWRCVCIAPKGDGVCGREVMKPTHYLTRKGFRACPECSEAHQKEARKGFNRLVLK